MGSQSGAYLSWETTAYILSNKPSLYKEFNYDITNENVTLERSTWYMRQAHLHPNSSFAINSCVTEVTDCVKLCVIQGKKNFSNWLNKMFCNGPEYSINYCSQNASASHQIVEHDDTYFFIHHTNCSDVHSVRVNISIHSLDYSIQSSVKNCTMSRFELSCTAEPIQLGFKGLALISTNVAEVAANESLPSWSWEDTMQVSWSCETSYDTFMLIIFLPFSVGSLVLICMLCSVLCCVIRCHSPRHKAMQEQTLVTDPLIIKKRIIRGMSVGGLLSVILFTLSWKEFCQSLLMVILIVKS